MSALAVILILVLVAMAGLGLIWLLVRYTRHELARQLRDIAGPELQLLGQQTVHQVQTTDVALQARLSEMQARLESYQGRITAFEKERAAADAKLEQQLQLVVGAGAAMTQEARTLREALATSNSVRGDWGESVLQNIFAACGLHEQIDYDLQVSLAGGSLRPDAVVYLPSGRKLAVDAKASLSDFLAGLDASDEAARRACYAAFAQVLRRRAKELAGKDYCGQLENSMPCVVMFVPSEGAFRAALDADAGLYRYGQQLSPAILLASPSTLFPLISIVAQGWQQFKAGQQMQVLLQEITTLGQRLQVFLDHFQTVGKAIDAAGKAYNLAGSSYRSRLGPQLNKLQDLHANWEPPAELKAVENRPQLAESAQSSE
ncbi:MAG: DNA recombination protein RmuC [Terriglobales bacterium]